jgi:hypothetical protein
MKRLVLLGVVLTALASAPAAVAHGGGSPGVYSHVTAIRPYQPNLLVVVLGGDDRLRLTNRDNSDVVVFGYQNEPYLRWSGGAIFVNERSPATYLNADRYGAVPLPAVADPKAKPKWKQVSTGNTYVWHDHRIHWMSRQVPTVVADHPQSPQHIFDWTVPMEVNGKRVAIRGSLDYSPPTGADGNGPLALRAGLAAVALVFAGGLLFLLTRRRGKAAPVKG